MATDRQRRLLVTIATAMADAGEAEQRLRDALVTGQDTAGIRAEIAAINLRAADARNALDDISAAAARKTAGRFAESLTRRIAAESARIDSKLAALQPPPSPGMPLPLETDR